MVFMQLSSDVYNHKTTRQRVSLGSAIDSSKTYQRLTKRALFVSWRWHVKITMSVGAAQ